MNRRTECLPMVVEIKELRSAAGYRLFAKGKTDAQVFESIQTADIEGLKVSNVSHYSFSNGRLIVKIFSGDLRTANGEILGTKKDSVVYVCVPHSATIDPSDSEIELLNAAVRSAIERA